MDQMSTRMDELAGHMVEMGGRMGEMGGRLDRRIDEMGSRLDSRIDECANRIGGRIDLLAGQQERFAKEMSGLKSEVGALKRDRESADDLIHRVTRIEDRLFSKAS